MPAGGYPAAAVTSPAVEQGSASGLVLAAGAADLAAIASQFL
jgi:hypothetical protein